ncbi:MAG: hypothetical protein U0575_10140 [Phycisphaerales bacterium]
MEQVRAPGQAWGGGGRGAQQRSSDVTTNPRTIGKPARRVARHPATRAIRSSRAATATGMLGGSRRTMKRTVAAANASTIRIGGRASATIAARGTNQTTNGVATSAAAASQPPRRASGRPRTRAHA